MLPRIRISAIVGDHARPKHTSNHTSQSVSGKRKNKPPPPVSYRKRSYRRLVDQGSLTGFLVRVRETDLSIFASSDLRETAHNAVIHYRSQLEAYLAGERHFLTSLTPLAMDPTAPPMVRAMLQAGLAAQVGPMAAVAGAIAEYVGRDLLAAGSAEVTVENGGDIFLARNRECLVGIFAGTSPLNHRVGLKIPATAMPLGVCTSSGTVGHSLSLGKADAVTVLARDTALADGAATRLGNEVTPGRPIEEALAIARTIPGLLGAVIIRGRELGAWGEVELVPLGPSPLRGT